MAKRGTSFRLSEEGLGLINELSEKLGISQADVVEMSVRVVKMVIERETGGLGHAAVDGRPAVTREVPVLHDKTDRWLHSFTEEAVLVRNERHIGAAEEEWRRRGRPDVVPRVREQYGRNQDVGAPQ